MLFSDIFDGVREQASRCFRIVVGHLQAYPKARSMDPKRRF